MRRLALCLLLCASLLGGCRVTYDVERRGPATEELSSERIEGLRLTPAVRDHGLELRVERLFSRTYTVTTDVEERVEVRVANEGLVSLIGEPDRVLYYVLLPLTLTAAVIDLLTLGLTAPVMLCAAAVASIDSGLEVTTDVRMAGEPLAAEARIEVRLGDGPAREHTVGPGGRLRIDAQAAAARALEAGQDRLSLHVQEGEHSGLATLDHAELVALAAGGEAQAEPAVAVAKPTPATEQPTPPRTPRPRVRKEARPPASGRAAERARARLRIVWTSYREQGALALLDEDDLREFLALGTARARRMVSVYRGRDLVRGASAAVAQGAAQPPAWPR